MEYINEVREANFIERLNRFEAKVLLDGDLEVVHVRNTGRCKEIFKEGAIVYLEKAPKGAKRKTLWSVVAALKGDKLINIDSIAPNKVVKEAINKGRLKEFSDVKLLKSEAKYEKSRFDFYYEREDGRKGFIEVKGVTLEQDGIVMFPDAPTIRGTRHINELIKAKSEGLEANIIFVIQMKEIDYFRPNYEMDEEFSNALIKASLTGVNILAYDCIVKPNNMILDKNIEVCLKP